MAISDKKSMPPSPDAGASSCTHSEDEPVVIPDGFELSDAGLFFCPERQFKGYHPYPIHITGPFEVVGTADDGSGSNWGVVLRWKDESGHPHQTFVARRQAHKKDASIAERLVDAGLHCNLTPEAHAYLKKFINEVRGGRRMRVVEQAGWHRFGCSWVFMHPKGTAEGEHADRVVQRADSDRAARGFQSRGTLFGWQRDMAEYARGNSRVMLFISLAFASPLLDIVDEPNGGVNLSGDSRTGKTTAARASRSVWGFADHNCDLWSWRATANGLEALAAEISHIGLTLDEIGQANADQIGEIVYMVANGIGKIRAEPYGGRRLDIQIRVLFSSTGEITLDQKLREGNRRSTAGQETRFAEIPADAGMGMGIFEDLNGKASSAELVEWLATAIQAQHGTAGPAFLLELVRHRSTDPNGLRQTILGEIDYFVRQHAPVDANGQVRTVARRFGLIGAAGELAIRYSVLPWHRGEATRAAEICFKAWLSFRGTATEADRMVSTVRSILQKHASRFDEIAKCKGRLCLVRPSSQASNRLGFKCRSGNAGSDDWDYLFQSEAWLSHVCDAYSPERVGRVLLNDGYLRPSSDRTHYACRITIAGHGRDWFYVVSGTILGGDHAKPP